jgi:hypothetical protein
MRLSVGTIVSGIKEVGVPKVFTSILGFKLKS